MGILNQRRDNYFTSETKSNDQRGSIQCIKWPMSSINGAIIFPYPKTKSEWSKRVKIKGDQIPGIKWPMISQRNSNDNASLPETKTKWSRGIKRMPQMGNALNQSSDNSAISKTKTKWSKRINSRHQMVHTISQSKKQLFCHIRNQIKMIKGDQFHASNGQYAQSN